MTEKLKQNAERYGMHDVAFGSFIITSNIEIDWHCDVMLGAGICLQSAGRPPRLPGRHTFEAEHGNTRSESCSEGESAADW